MADIFGRGNTGFGGAFTSAKAAMNISGDDVGEISKLLVSNLQANYTQPLSRIYELASDRAYFVVGRPEGNGNIGAVFGPKAHASVAYADLADPCKKTNLELKFKSGASCGPAGKALSTKWGRKLTCVILQSLGFQVNAQDMLINENIGFQYAALEPIGE